MLDYQRVNLPVVFGRRRNLTYKHHRSDIYIYIYLALSLQEFFSNPISLKGHNCGDIGMGHSCIQLETVLQGYAVGYGGSCWEMAVRYSNGTISWLLSPGFHFWRTSRNVLPPNAISSGF